VNAGPRTVLPELLDELAPDDPRARRSRGDLRRIHVAMGSAAILARTFARVRPGAPPRRIVELGAGDGTLLLRVARRLGWRDVELTLLDRVDLLDDATRAAYAALGWRVRAKRGCALDWARAAVGRAPSGSAASQGAHSDSDSDSGSASGQHYDLCVASLFLHHFAADDLGELLRGVAARADAFVALEPRRGRLARFGSRLVALLGANAVTRADAVTSVDAGFAGRELSSSWPSGPSGPQWHLVERAAGPFAHCFVATRSADDGR
jgi:hypothetical protein